MPPGVPLIHFREVAVCYEPEDRYPINALEGIDLSIEAGEWVFLVGPSGAGKSTLLKLIYCGAQATRGSIIIDGRDTTNLAARDIPLLRRRIGVIFQDFQLLPQKTVWENVAFALQVIGAPQKRLVRDVPQALETVGLHQKAKSLPHQLSGGEQQRVAIARAIVNQPAILLADEPTGNLDPQTGQDIIEVLQRVHETGTTVVMSTHDRAVVDRLRRRVVRLADGRVVSDEPNGVYHPEDGVLHQPISPTPIVREDQINSSLPNRSTFVPAIGTSAAGNGESAHARNDSVAMATNDGLIHADDVFTDENHAMPRSMPSSVNSHLRKRQRPSLLGPETPLGSETPLGPSQSSLAQSDGSAQQPDH